VLQRTPQKEEPVLKHLLPQELGFFDLFEKQADLAVEGAKLLAEFVQDLEAPGTKAHRIEEVEHQADVITHQTIEMLHKTFITPFDREAIHRLISAMDDILDAIEAASERLWLYEVTVTTTHAKEIAQVLRQATEQLRIAVVGIRNLKRDGKAIKAACVDVNRLENEGDEALRQGLAKLFREEKDPLVVMKWKEIYENMEQGTDRCEDVADVIEGLLLENE
jgi:hypothetical protein